MPRVAAIHSIHPPRSWPPAPPPPVVPCVSAADSAAPRGSFATCARAPAPPAAPPCAGATPCCRATPYYAATRQSRASRSAAAAGASNTQRWGCRALAAAAPARSARGRRRGSG
eukprot:1733994-Prymnesium_polylepis.1